MNNIDLKHKILMAIEAAEDKGYTLITDEWGDDTMRCVCALGCVAVADGIKITDEVDITANLLGVSEDWVISFTDGFDNNGIAEGSLDPKAWKLGQEIREHAKPMGYMTFIESMESDHE
jgi:hypothetical protein